MSLYLFADLNNPHYPYHIFGSHRRDPVSNPGNGIVVVVKFAQTLVQNPSLDTIPDPHSDTPTWTLGTPAAARLASPARSTRPPTAAISGSYPASPNLISFLVSFAISSCCFHPSLPADHFFCCPAALVCTAA